MPKKLPRDQGIVRAILGKKYGLHHKRTGTVLQYLVKWEDELRPNKPPIMWSDEKHDEWVPVDDINPALVEDYEKKISQELPSSSTTVTEASETLSVGEETPKRKRGRPRKQIVVNREPTNEEDTEVMKEKEKKQEEEAVAMMESLTTAATTRVPVTEVIQAMQTPVAEAPSSTPMDVGSDNPETSSSSSVRPESGSDDHPEPPQPTTAPEKKSIKFADSEKYKNLRAGIDPEGRLTTIRMDELGRPYTVPYDPVQAEKDEKEGKKRGLMLIGKRADGSFARAFDDINHPALGFNRKAQGKIVIEEKICTFEGQRFVLFAFRELKQFQFVHIDIAKRVALDEFFKLAQHPDFRRK